MNNEQLIEGIERQIIGYLINDVDEHLDAVLSRLGTGEIFLNPCYSKIFKAILKERTSNLLTLRVSLNESGLDNAALTLVEISNDKIPHSNVFYLIDKLEFNRRKIKTLQLGNRLMQSAESSESDEELELKKAEIMGELSKLEESTQEDRYSVENPAIELDYYIKSRTPGKLMGLSCGIDFIDRVTDGFQLNRCYRIGAGSNTGKSQIAFQMINSFLSQGKRVAFFTLENAAKITVCQLLSAMQGVDSEQLLQGNVSADYSQLFKYDRNRQIYLIDDKYDISSILLAVKKIKPDVVVLDYIGLVESSKLNKPEDIFAQYAVTVQKFLKEYPTTWVDLSQIKMGADEDMVRAYGQFFGSNNLRSATDVGIHLMPYMPFFNYRNKEIRQGTDTPDMHKISMVHMMVTKNRYGTARVEKVFKIDFRKGGKFTPVSQEELELYTNND